MLLDGNIAYTLHYVSNKPKTLGAVVADTGDEALAKAVKEAGAPCAVGLLLPRYAVKAIDATVAHDQPDTFAELVFERVSVSADNTAVAGDLYRQGHEMPGDLVPSVAVLAPAAGIEAFGAAASTKLHPALLALRGIDGLHLLLNWSGADLVVVENGRVRAAKSIEAGGLDAVCGVLGPNGRNDVGEAISGRVSPAAGAELTRWAHAIATELATSVSRWESAGMRLPRSVQLHGAGAAWDGISDILTSLGWGLLRDETLQRELAQLPREQLPVAALAHLVMREKLWKEPLNSFYTPQARLAEAKAVKIDDPAKTVVRVRSRRRALVWVASSIAVLLTGVVIAMMLTRPVEIHNNPGPRPESSEPATNPTTAPDSAALTEKSCTELLTVMRAVIAAYPDASDTPDAKRRLLNEAGVLAFDICSNESKAGDYQEFYNNEFAPWSNTQ